MSSGQLSVVLTLSRFAKLTPLSRVLHLRQHITAYAETSKPSEKESPNAVGPVLGEFPQAFRRAIPKLALPDGLGLNQTDPPCYCDQRCMSQSIDVLHSLVCNGDA